MCLFRFGIFVMVLSERDCSPIASIHKARREQSEHQAGDSPVVFTAKTLDVHCPKGMNLGDAALGAMHCPKHSNCGFHLLFQWG